MSVFAQSLGASFSTLPPALQDFHAGASPRHFIGTASVEHGTNPLARMGIKLGGFPPAGRSMPFAIRVTQTAQGECWARDFDGHITQSTLMYDHARQQIVERLGALTCALQLSQNAGQLHVDVARLWLFGVPLPSILLPRSFSREWQDDGGAFCFDIGAHLPGGALLIRYQGRLVPQL
ncbi:MAG: DUF4166 domain-containing protein [Sulfitobacter sp.]